MSDTTSPFWIDIGTAPKDGSTVDLWCVRYELPDPSKPDVRKISKRFTDCRWVDPSRSAGTNYIVGITGGLQESPAKWEGAALTKDWRPTHWMPLPAPPS